MRELIVYIAFICMRKTKYTFRLIEKFLCKNIVLNGKKRRIGAFYVNYWTFSPKRRGSKGKKPYVAE